VDRLAHERPLDHLAALERPVELRALELLEARPEADVGVQCVLVLDPGQPLDRTRDRQLRALEQQLARE
jgi:hypothetical protein